MPSIRAGQPSVNMKMEPFPLISRHLYEISQVLQVSFSQLSSYLPTVEEKDTIEAPFGRKSPFFQAKRLYFYFYDGRYHRMKDGIIDISERAEQQELMRQPCPSVLSPETVRSSEIFYTGRVIYSDMLIRFSFVNQYNPLEEDLLYIFNPLEMRDFTDGLLCGISSAD